MTEELEQRAFIVDSAVLSKIGKSRRRRSMKSRVANAPKGAKGTRTKSIKTAVRNCEVCGLDKDIRSPKMEPFGEGKLKIAIVGDYPDTKEDFKDRPFIGEPGMLLKEALLEYGISLDKDCFQTNAFQCMPPSGKERTRAPKLKFWTDCCRARLEKQLLDFKPELIIALGSEAMRTIFRTSFKDPFAAQYRGLVIPSNKYNCWVGCCQHPSFLFKKNMDLKPMFIDDIGQALSFLGKKVPGILPCNFDVLDTIPKVKEFFQQHSFEAAPPMAFDYEANMLQPYNEAALLHCCSFSEDPEKGYFLPLQFRNYWTPAELEDVFLEMADWLTCKRPKVAQNRAMEEKWSKVFFSVEVANIIQDTMVGNHVLYNRKKTCGLDFQTHRLTGHDYKNEIDVTKEGWADKEPEEKIQIYSTYDSQYTILTHYDQMEQFERMPEVRHANAFFQRCLPALVRMEIRGAGVDRDLLTQQQTDAVDKQKEAARFLGESDYVDRFKAKTGRKEFGPGSDADFRDLFYSTLDLKPPNWRTPGGKLPADKNAVEFIVNSVEDAQLKEFCEQMMLWRRLDTLLSTFLGGFDKAIQGDGLIHPSFLLHTVDSYRSSSSDPNFQNLPKRAEEHANFRKIIIPHIGTIIGETDAAGAEVGTMAMLSGDPVLTKQVQEGFDPHTYWAAKIFEVREQDVTKFQRFMGKNKLVFPLFYGSYYKSIARDCDVSISHAQKVEKEFWRMYKGVKRWQEETVKFYNQYGYVKMPMGFRRYGPLSRNQIFNTPVQGTSFHMLLESIYRTDKEMTERGMKSGLVIEVHDSMVPDMVEEELEDVMEICIRHMTEKQFDWQGEVPRGAEWLDGPNWGEQNEKDVKHLFVR